jgi:hypothetical protein
MAIPRPFATIDGRKAALLRTVTSATTTMPCPTIKPTEKIQVLMAAGSKSEKDSRQNTERMSTAGSISTTRTIADSFSTKKREQQHNHTS